MNQTFLSILIAFVCFLPSCSPAPEQYKKLETRVVEALVWQPVLIQVDHGELTVLESEDDHIEVGGEALLTDDLEYQVGATNNQITIKILVQHDNISAPPVRALVHIPKQMKMRIETDSASVFVQDFDGDVEVASTSGNITIEQVQGKLILGSNRGNIVVRESSGSMSVVGNYGGLHMQNVHGETAASTIMGNVVFDGLIKTGDAVRIETDHGSVSINLGQDSGLGIQVRSTSGDVTCMIPGINSSTRACDGQIGVGDGTLHIRTVSGAVTLQLNP